MLFSWRTRLAEMLPTSPHSSKPWILDPQIPFQAPCMASLYKQLIHLWSDDFDGYFVVWSVSTCVTQALVNTHRHNLVRMYEKIPKQSYVCREKRTVRKYKISTQKSVKCVHYYTCAMAVICANSHKVAYLQVDIVFLVFWRVNIQQQIWETMREYIHV